MAGVIRTRYAGTMPRVKKPKPIPASKSKSAPAPAQPEYTPAELAAMLTRAGLGTITVEMIEAHVSAGLPAPGGKVHLLQYAAWLNKDTDVA